MEVIRAIALSIEVQNKPPMMQISGSSYLLIRLKKEYPSVDDNNAFREYILKNTES